MTTTIEIATDYVSINCGRCGVSFAITDGFYRARRADHKSFYCPNGCCRAYKIQSDEERLRSALHHERVTRQNLSNRLETANRSRAALKGQVTKIKRRVGKGICPCCRRNFALIGMKRSDGMKTAVQQASRAMITHRDFQRRSATEPQRARAQGLRA